jgi:phage repressor protein C with HTH and peptisase S24 domain
MVTETILNRLDKFMAANGLKDRHLEQRCGISNGLLNNLRKKGGELGQKSIERILKTYPEINTDWFIRGEGEMLLTSSSPPVKAVVEVVEHGTPVYDVDATCGDVSRPIVFTDEHVIGHVNLPNASPTAVIIRANGDSMEPHIHDGDWIAVREVANLNVLYYGQVYLVITNEYRLLKYLRRDEDEQHYVLLRSANENYDDIRLPKADIRHLFIVENILSLHIKL